jgi:hypothetical protein
MASRASMRFGARGSASPLVDAERGIVFNLTLLLYKKAPNLQWMYVSETFRAVNHKIVQIDNIGLMMQGVSTTGFIH